LLPPIFRLPPTVAEPALILHEVVVVFTVGWFTVTPPVTVRALDPPCVNEEAVALAASVSDEQELSLFIVYVAPVAIDTAGNVVEVVPPIVLVPPVNVMVLVPPERVPPLFVQLPPTLRPKLLPLVLKVPEVSVRSFVNVSVPTRVLVPLPLIVRLL
jgi:hypothetical protein